MKTENQPEKKGAAVVPAAETKLIITDGTVADKIFGRIADLERDGELSFPPHYSYANALKSAWLILQRIEDKNNKRVLAVCTKESIVNSLLDMVIQGLSPSKRQCYFIPYGKELTLIRSYKGTVAVTKRMNGVEDVFAREIWNDDEFNYKINLATGLIEITQHDTKFENIDMTKLRGAYCVILRKDKPSFIEIMNRAQIEAAWKMGSGYGKSKTHATFTEQMAKKTVINRACQVFFDTSDDSDLLVEAVSRSSAAEAHDDSVYEEAAISEEISTEANKQLLDIPADESASSQAASGSNSEPGDVEKAAIEKKELEESYKNKPDY